MRLLIAIVLLLLAPSIVEAGGACCLATTCYTTTQDSCEIDLVGIWMGEGTSCTGNPCDDYPSGACCIDDGACVIKTQLVCEYSGGTFQGAATICSPNPCPQPPTGACCLPDSSCATLSAIACTALDGTYRGDAVACIPNPCASIPPPYQFTGHRFGLLVVSITEATAEKYIKRLVNHPDSLWRATLVSDEHGWRPIKGASGVTACQTVGLQGFSDCNLCGHADCLEGLSWDLCCYYYAAPAARSAYPAVPNTSNLMMAFRVAGYDSVPPDSVSFKNLRDHIPTPVSRFDTLTAYADWLISGYPTIKEWSVSNEVESPQYWGSTPGQYLAVVETLRTHLLDSCSDCRVAISFQLPGLGVGYLYPGAEAWWVKLASNADVFDIVDTHYNITRWPADTLLTQWERVAPGKEMICMEVGVLDSLYGGEMPGIGGTPLKQAQDLPKLLTMLFDVGYHRLSVNLYDHDNGGKNAPFFLHASIVNEDGAPKQSFWAYKTMIRKVDRFTSVEKLAVGQYRYEFGHHGRVYLFWSGAFPVSLFRNYVLVTDAVTGGNRIVLSGKVTITEGEPIWVSDYPDWTLPGTGEGRNPSP